MYTTVENAVAQLKQGKPIIVVDDEGRENEGDFVALGQFATPEMINFMATEGRGLICTPVAPAVAERLALTPMVAHNSDPYGTAFTVSIDFETTHTGISAGERSETVLKMLDQTTKPEQFNRPGHIFPLIAKDGGVLERPGHTEAAIDLAKLADASPVGVICEIMNEDGTMAKGSQLEAIAKRLDLVILTIDALIDYQKQQQVQLERSVTIPLPTRFGMFQMAAFVEQGTGKEHLALWKGDVERVEDVLVRVHSECVTGDIFHSERCDCGEQLDRALAEIETAGKGIILYLRQEGRGIGLVNKLKAYALQDQGYDTVEANVTLGFPDDARTYDIAANILTQLGVASIALLTNNPRKIAQLETAGVTISKRVPIELATKPSNARYMETKKEKLGHLLTIK